jgi:hypothetical protein
MEIFQIRCANIDNLANLDSHPSQQPDDTARAAGMSNVALQNGNSSNPCVQTYKSKV